MQNTIEKFVKNNFEKFDEIGPIHNEILIRAVL